MAQQYISRAVIVTHKLKPIFFMDFSDLKKIDEIALVIADSKKYIHLQPKNSLLALTYLSNMFFSSEIRDMFVSFVTSNKPYIKSSAVVGLSGMQRIVFNSIMVVTGRSLKAFEDIESAKEWLYLQG